MTRARDAELSALSSDVRDLLVRRSERIRAPEKELAPEEDTFWVATFGFGGREHAIALSALRAIVPLGAITPVPFASHVVIGVFQFQGEVIAALSMAALLADRWSVDPTMLLVVDAGGGHTVALDCAEVPMATTLPLASYRLAATTAKSAFIHMTIPGRGDATVIDLPRLLQNENFMVLDGKS